jgi:hypothetical protein
MLDRGNMPSHVTGAGAETPLSAITRLAASAASGELIVASDAVEVHVYFLDGRLAWATSSTARQRFIDHLVEQLGVSGDAIRDVIEECHRSRRRLGETLVSWGVATEAQVRDALGAQIIDALATVEAHPHAQMLFLPRRMSYDRALTFDLAELVTSRAPTDLDDLATTIITTVLDSIPETLWVEVVSAEGVVARAARGATRPGEELAVLRRTLDDHAMDSLVVRRSGGVVVGHRLPARDAAVWCACGPEVKLGMVVHLLASAAGATASAPQASSPPETWQERPAAQATAATRVLTSAMKTSDDLIAGLVLDRDGRAGGAWRGPDDLDAHAAVARALAPVLRVQLRDSLARPVDRLVYEQVAVRGQRGKLAFHGTAPAGVPGSLWLVVPAWASQGLGWALLDAVSRQAADGAGGES